MLFLGSIGMFFQRREAVERQRQAMLERELKGPYRAVITRVERVPVSAIEAAAGFDTKLTIYLTDLGHPVGLPIKDNKFNRRVSGPLQLVGIRNGERTRLKTAVETYQTDPLLRSDASLILYTMQAQPRSELREGIIAVLAKSSAFPDEAEVRLEGPLTWTLFAGPSDFHTPPLQFSYRLRAAKQPTALPAFSQSVVKVELVNATYFSPSFQHTNAQYGATNTLVRLFVRGTKGMEWDSSKVRWIDNSLYDHNGRRWSEPVPRESGSTSGEECVTFFKVSAADVPESSGELAFRGAVSPDGSSPAPFSVVVRPAWITKRPVHLKLENVTVQGVNVLATVRYDGKREVRYNDNSKGFGAVSGLPPEFLDNRNEYYNSEVLPFYRATWRQRGMSSPGPQDLQGMWWSDKTRDYLISTWSQHLTLGGKEYWSPKSVAMQSITNLGEGRYRVVYKTNAVGLLKYGEKCRFDAQIGLKGEGFLPIQATIVKP